MITIAMILIAILTLILLFSIYILFKNEQVGKFRIKLINKIKEGAKEDIKNNKDWKWRYKEFDKVNYNKMIYSFKKLKPENFWDDISFLE